MDEKSLLCSKERYLMQPHREREREFLSYLLKFVILAFKVRLQFMSLYTFSVILCFSDLPLFICFLFDLSLSNSRAVVSKLTIILCLQKFKLTDLQWPTVYLQVRVNVTCTLPHILVICNISDKKKLTILDGASISRELVHMM